MKKQRKSNEKKDNQILSPDILQILSERIDKYMNLTKEFKYLTNAEYMQKSSSLFSDTIERYIDFTKRALENKYQESEEILTYDNLLEISRDLDKNDIDQICKTFDELLCIAEPIFKKVVEYKPKKISIKKKNILKNELVKKEVEILTKINKNMTTDQIFHLIADKLNFSYGNVKYLYYYKLFKKS